MQDNYEAPVTGSVRVEIETAQVIADFLLVFLQMSDSPLTMDQIKEFSAFRDVVKAGPTQELKFKPGQSVLSDGIILGSGPKCMFDRHIALKYLRAMISNTMTDELQVSLQLALVGAVATKGPKVNTGINGKFCAGTFGYSDPEQAKDYLSGHVNEIIVKRNKTLRHCMPSYFDQGPNFYLGVERKEFYATQGA